MEDKKQEVVVALVRPPKTNYSVTGGLADQAIANAAGGHFKRFLNEYQPKPLSQLPEKIVSDLRKNGISARITNQTITTNQLPKFPSNNLNEYAFIDYRSLANQLKADKLLLINVTEIGATRPTTMGVVPIGGPIGHISMSGQLIDLKTNRVLWGKVVVEHVKSNNKWYQPPNFPYFENSMNLMVENAASKLQYQLFKNATVQSEVTA